MNNKILWLWLNETAKISHVKQLKLFNKYETIENIYNADESSYKTAEFLNQKDIEKLLNKDISYAEKQLELLKAKNAWLFTIDDADYPSVLKEISDPPCVLYCKGNRVDLNRRLCIAVVGTRKPTNYGRLSAFNLSKSLASDNVIIVSGMAIGCDTKAHEGALAAKGTTVAVIGSGIDIVYPPSNAGLVKKIEKTGLVISEYPLGAKPERFHFPERNRIISGLCQGTLVIEADIKSGSLITAKSAYEQGRDVFAVPGNINSVYSKGTNYLIKDGAKPVTCDEDIISCYRYDYADRLIFDEVIELNETFEETNKSSDIESILNDIISEEPVHIDNICALSKLDTGSVNSALMLMELSGKVVKLPGGYYVKG